MSPSTGAVKKATFRAIALIPLEDVQSGKLSSNLQEHTDYVKRILPESTAPTASNVLPIPQPSATSIPQAPPALQFTAASAPSGELLPTITSNDEPSEQRQASDRGLIIESLEPQSMPRKRKLPDWMEESSYSDSFAPKRPLILSPNEQPPSEVTVEPRKRVLPAWMEEQESESMPRADEKGYWLREPASSDLKRKFVKIAPRSERASRKKLKTREKSPWLM